MTTPNLHITTKNRLTLAAWTGLALTGLLMLTSPISLAASYGNALPPPGLYRKDVDSTMGIGNGAATMTVRRDAETGAGAASFQSRHEDLGTVKLPAPKKSFNHCIRAATATQAVPMPMAGNCQVTTEKTDEGQISTFVCPTSKATHTTRRTGDKTWEYLTDTEVTGFSGADTQMMLKFEEEAAKNGNTPEKRARAAKNVEKMKAELQSVSADGAAQGRGSMPITTRVRWTLTRIAEACE